MINRRFTLLINKKFQLSTIAWFIFLAVIVSLTYLFAINEFLDGLKMEAKNAGLQEGHAIFSYIDLQSQKLYRIITICSAISLAIIVFGGLFLSHRVAGPLYKLTQHFKSSTKDDVQPIKFRKNDYFQEVADAFNDFISRAPKK